MRERFLEKCRAYGLSGIWLAIADTIARFESSYDSTAVGDGGAAYGWFQINLPWSPQPFKSRRQAGLLLSETEQIEEWWTYMQNPYNRPESVWELFRRYNGSGPAAEYYADRAVAYFEDQWAEYSTDSLRVVDISREARSMAPSSASQATNGASLLLALPLLFLVGSQP